MKQFIVIKHDKNEDKTIEVTTVRTDDGYLIKMTAHVDGVTLLFEKFTECRYTAELKHEEEVERLIRKKPARFDLDRIYMEEVRPEIKMDNSFLHDAPDFGPMLPGIV